ncbi:hypothetical protein VTL71DRAFT_10721 [Oculimacula yallundae]|uniref:F-box domain-containing protein n=1 Tax=Oculimacula yallundae TaxID=86028 RepID=A0ABR4CUX8_9HELO
MSSRPRRPRLPKKLSTIQPRVDKGKRKEAIIMANMQGNAIAGIQRSSAPFLNLPPEIHFQIFELLEDTFDAICFSLISKKLYVLTSSFTLRLPLSSGSPTSERPRSQPKGCRHCVPVLYAPAHCELHFHIRSFFPKRYKYCGNCDKYTSCEQKEWSGNKEKCGRCGVGYRRRFERGRRLLVKREGREGREGRNARLVKGNVAHNEPPIGKRLPIIPSISSIFLIPF